MPDISDRYADAQFTPMGLGAGGIEHAGPQDAEFELADAALHAEQQAIVGLTRVIDAVEIDDARVHQAAQLEQVVPVAAVARQARSIEA